MIDLWNYFCAHFITLVIYHNDKYLYDSYILFKNNFMTYFHACPVFFADFKIVIVIFNYKCLLQTFIYHDQLMNKKD